MRVPPPVIALTAAVAQRALTSDAAPATGARRTVAAVAAGSAVAMMGSAMREFRTSGTTVDPVHPERASVLVTGGPFGLTRNPMYVGLAGLLLAHTVLRGSLKALPPLALFVVAIDRLQIPTEEAALASRFGSDYDAYRHAVPRWVGLR